jgi:hypothetical protein
MNKLILVGAIILGGGLASAVTGSIISGEPMMPMARIEDYEAADPHVEEIALVEQLELDLSNRSINVFTHEAATVELHYYVADHDRIDVELVGTTLRMTSDVDPFVHMWGWAMFRNPEIFMVEVYIPTASTLDLSARTSNGVISLTDIGSIGNLSLHSSNGAIKLDAVLECQTLTGETSNGRLELDDVTALEEITLRTSNGRIVYDDVSAPEIYSRTSNGNIVVTNLVTNDLELISSNGDIEATLPGTLANYRVNMETTNGNYYLNGSKVSTNAYNTSLSNKIRLATSNGDIRLVFLG